MDRNYKTYSGHLFLKKNFVFRLDLLCLFLNTIGILKIRKTGSNSERTSNGFVLRK